MDIVKWIYCSLICLTISGLSAQSLSDIETERRQLLEEIKATTKALSTTGHQREDAHERVQKLSHQISKRHKLITLTNQEVDSLKIRIARSEEVIRILETDQEALQQSYATILQSAVRQRLRQSTLVFLFSARSISDAYARWLFLRRYQYQQRHKLHTIQATQEMLIRKNHQLSLRKLELESLLNYEQQQSTLLSAERRMKNNILGRLSAEEQVLMNALAENEERQKALNWKLKTLIQKEEKKRKKALVSTATKPKSKPKTKPSIEHDSSDAIFSDKPFASLKGKLPWPLVSSELTSKFGNNPHPQLRKVVIPNNGIDLRPTGDAAVRAIHHGKIITVGKISHQGYTVIMQHDSYYTVYSNLTSVSVVEGEFISGGTRIGKVNNTGDTNKELHFEIWKQTNTLDPVKWLER